jgi:signal-transduction protein with cAMP-binding, CBS, and nucleotidyltransferase domain
MNISIEKVGKLMSGKVFSVDAAKNIKQAATEMTEKEVGSLMVTRGGDFVGIITQSNIVRKVVSLGLDPATITVTKVMSSPVVTIDATQSLKEANGLMKQNKIKHLGVTRNDKIVGVLSVRDLLHSVDVE